MISMTDVELSKLLTDLEKTAKALNEASARVNTILLSCENKIQSLNLGIEVWLDDIAIDLSDKSDFEDPSTSSQIAAASLGFAKVQNIWCLATKISPDKSKVNSPIPLLQAPRKVRMGAVELLPRLVRALSQRATMRLAAIQTAEKLVS
jgi:hypothetical protein